MLALAIEFSRCSRIRTLKAEQCVLMAARRPYHSFALPKEDYWPWPAGECQKSNQCIDLESLRYC